MRRTLDLGEGDLAVDDVGGDEEFVDGAAVVLAGRIRESRLGAVEAVARRRGGVVLTSLPERRARSRPDAGHRAPS